MLCQLETPEGAVDDVDPLFRIEVSTGAVEDFGHILFMKCL